MIMKKLLFVTLCRRNYFAGIINPNPILFLHPQSISGSCHHLCGDIHDRVRGCEADVEIEQDGFNTGVCYFRFVLTYRSGIWDTLRCFH